MTITAAADGSALGNPGPAGWAWYVDDNSWAAGGWPHATNNQGELKAVLELFRATADDPDDLLVLCDSQYVINSVTKWMPGWKKKGWRKSDGKPVLNVELLKELDQALTGRRYRFEWVKGHANHPLNEAADARARAVAEAFQRRAAIPAGPGWRSFDDHRRSAGASGQEEESPAIVVAPRTHPALFSFDDQHDGESVASGRHSVTLTLNDTEHARLLERARRRGVSVDELLRDLI
ncbi:MAG: ribonuclease [Cryobacterium sp.]|jgi:ribonuclease HI|nr:ribonuclease [Cryobacterium sp.]